MKVAHYFAGDYIEKECGNAGFLLTNNTGGWLYLCSKPVSKYNGLFFFHQGKTIKTLADIRIIPEVTKIINRLTAVAREREQSVEEFSMPKGSNSLLYSIRNFSGQAYIDMECREAYNDDQRPDYHVEIKDKLMTVGFRTDTRQFYLAAFSDAKFEEVSEFREVVYEHDQKRNSRCNGRMFTPCRIQIHDHAFISFGFSADREEAIGTAMKSSARGGMRDTRFPNLNKLIPDINLRMAYNCCLNSLQSLVTEINNVKGIYAGLPWFFQFWLRDELVSLNSLKKLDSAACESILERDAGLFLADGRLPVKHDARHPCADASGWFFLRAGDQFHRFINKEMLHKLRENNKGELVTNSKHETWMDSIDREGARIEIQSLWMNIFRLLDPEREAELRERVRSIFWNREMLADGQNDFTVRPNIFIAAYAYPELLSREEWIACFDNSLKKLWCSWGGLSTIERDSGYFVSRHTGENPRSYHSGDSWFYINNLAAMMLHRLDKERFREHINKIISASVEDILWRGAVGHHSELSSADSFEPSGCVAQAWSAAMFIEMVNALFSKGIKQNQFT